MKHCPCEKEKADDAAACHKGLMGNVWREVEEEVSQTAA